jgi:hypothetical protein
MGGGMSLSIDQARDEMSALFMAALDASAYADDLVIWDDLADAPDKERSRWWRFAIRHADGGNAAIGGRLFRRYGTVWVQMYAPAGEGLSTLDQMGKVALTALEGQSTPGGVWFRNVRPREAGREGVWQQMNVLADFVYDEVR